MTPTEVCQAFNELYAMSDAELLEFRVLAMVEWGRVGDPVSELIALQAEYACSRRGLM